MGTHLYRPESQPDATGFSEETSANLPAESSQDFEDSIEQPGSIASQNSLVVTGFPSSRGEAPAPSKKMDS